MLKQVLACLFLVAPILGVSSSSAFAQTEPPLPACQPWTPGPQLSASPAAVEDNTLFNVGGYPLQSGLTNGVLKSTDRGITWQQLDNPSSGHLRFSANYRVDHTIAILPWPFAQTHISSDGGVTWRTIVFPRPDPNAFALGDAQHLFAGYGRELPPSQRVPGEVQVSHDGGQTWQHIAMGLSVDRIFVSPAFAQDRTVLMSLGAYHYNGGLVMSTDAGLTWQRADAGLDLSGLGIYSLAFSPQYATDRTLFCYDSSAVAWGVYKSTDAAAIWQHLPEARLDFGSSPPDLLISPRYPQDQTLWLLEYYRAIVSRDGGQTWQPATAYPLWLQAVAEYCLPSGECGVELYGAGLERGEGGDTYYLYRSYDYGQTWQCLEDPTPPPGSQPPAPPAEIPEPATWLLLASGVAGLAGWLRRHGAPQL